MQPRTPVNQTDCITIQMVYAHAQYYSPMNKFIVRCCFCCLLSIRLLFVVCCKNILPPRVMRPRACNVSMSSLVFALANDDVQPYNPSMGWNIPQNNRTEMKIGIPATTTTTRTATNNKHQNFSLYIVVPERRSPCPFTKNPQLPKQPLIILWLHTISFHEKKKKLINVIYTLQLQAISRSHDDLCHFYLSHQIEKRSKVTENVVCIA